MADHMTAEQMSAELDVVVDGLRHAHGYMPTDDQTIVSAIHRLSAIAARLSGMAADTWQPIETAPTDGTHILARLPDSDTCYVICWADSRVGVRAELGHKVGWHIAYCGDFIDPIDEPTHWMPLPAAPEPPHV